ncbi:CarD family transcriptional regulator [Niameybacter massiliensis]|uniref:CarD family transcriptional regulator n=1 Tax=Niameybacter massiliensis TaxID=1658108 RepID=UPI0006B5AFFE|nr:CarD family transcriptional regulator [Niameybacter massiliensis]
MFQVGDYIIYGYNNVCRVEEIGKFDIQGTPQDKEYYYLVPVYAPGSKVFTPVDNNKVMMRPILTKEEAWALIDELKVIEPLEIFDFRRKEEIYKEALKSCDCREWAKIIKTVYLIREERQAKGKKATASDEKYFNIAKEELHKELAIVLDIARDEVEDVILARI